MLGRFGLSGHHHLQPIMKLSGGQKARVVFTSIALSNAHILLLDEPTNHLDMQVGGGGGWWGWVWGILASIQVQFLNRSHLLCFRNPIAPTTRSSPPLCLQSIDALAEALEEFEGGVVVISHDARLLSRICDDAEAAEVWIVEDGEVHPWDGDFEDYKDELIKEIAKEMDEQEAEEARRQVCGGHCRADRVGGGGRIGERGVFLCCSRPATEDPAREMHARLNSTQLGSTRRLQAERDEKRRLAGKK